MLKQLAIAAATASLTLSAFAADGTAVEKTYELKDGSTVFIYKDGKMAMENKVGRTFLMEEGHIMETKDGKKLMMKGNEIYRVDKLHDIHRGS